MKRSFRPCAGRILAFAMLLSIQADLREEQLSRSKANSRRPTTIRRIATATGGHSRFSALRAPMCDALMGGYAKNGKFALYYDGTNVYRSLQTLGAPENSLTGILISPLLSGSFCGRSWCKA